MLLRRRIDPCGLLPRAGVHWRMLPFERAGHHHAVEFDIDRKPVALFDLHFEFDLMGSDQLRDALSERREHKPS